MPKNADIITLVVEIALGFLIAAIITVVLAASIRPIEFVYQGY